MERLEVHGVHLAQSIRLARSPDSQRLPLVAHRQQQRQREVVAQDACVVHAMELDRIDVHRVVGDRLPRLREIDDFGQRLLDELGIRGAKEIEHPADRILRQVGEPRTRQQLDDLGGQVRADVVRSDSSLFSHFHLLAQLVANALQALPHHCVVDAGVRGETRRAPAAVIPAVAELPFFGSQRQQRARQPLPLRLRPPASRPRPAPVHPACRRGTATSAGVPAAC